MRHLLFLVGLLISSLVNSQESDTALCKEFPFSGTGIFYSTRFTSLKFIGTLSTPVIQKYKTNPIYQAWEPKIAGRLFVREVNKQPYYSKGQNGLIWKSTKGGKYSKSDDYNGYDGGLTVLMKDSIYLEGVIDMQFSPVDSLLINGYILFEGLTDRYPFQLTLLPYYNSFEDFKTSFKVDYTTITPAPKSLLELRGIRLSYVFGLENGIPDTLRYCKNLESLWLNGIPNKPLPNFLFTDLPHLKKIRITQSAGSDWHTQKGTLPFVLPMKLFHLQGLKEISLQDLNLEIPDSIPEQNTIESMEFLYCGLDLKLPPSFFNLIHLKYLKISPVLSVIPENLNRFSKLEKLSIQIENGAKIPEGFGPWPNLKELNLSIWPVDQDFVSKLIADHPNAEIKINGKKVH
ncbi:hypothetical protein [uncultured Fluviicola sp.]|uniref:hypothetical protein n=1 Tax=uncultured Fluviicola sp. TaxID=463303 RepID=UPI0025F0B992|nr:hypothetical protein [uncultured Fluviicola sp.]